jgi:hypothetical protein
MMKTVDSQRSLYAADAMHLDFVGKDTFFGWLGQEGPRVFPDTDFACFYVLNNGRPSVPPSQMIRLLLLQGYCQVSDDEAIARSRFDLRWKVGLGLEDHEVLCAKSTLQTFRAKLLLCEQGRSILEKSVRVCRELGVLRYRRVKVAIDTTPIWGRGAVKDTYNLVADGLVKLLRELAAFETPLLEAVDVEGYARLHDFLRYVTGSSVKGTADLDWDDAAQRNAFLTELVRDIRRGLRLAQSVLAGADPALAGMRAGSAEDVQAAMALLAQLIEQDIEEVEGEGAHLKDGVARNRVPSVHDPEMRHGRKSTSQRFDGHKGEIVVEVESGVIFTAPVKAGNAADGEGCLAAVEQAEETLRQAWSGAEEADPVADPQTQAVVELTRETSDGLDVPLQQQPEGPARGRDEQSGAACSEQEPPVGITGTLGDCAYGTAANRRAFEDAQRPLDAKQATLHNHGRFTKEDFPKGPDGCRTCPGGHTVSPRTRNRDWHGKKVKVNGYQWSPDTCQNCPLREQCLAPAKEAAKDPRPRGRVITEHPEERILEKARAQQKTPEFRHRYRKRQVCEHRLARMIQLGGRQARYRGREKTQLQWNLLAAIANLTLAVAQKAATSARIQEKNLLEGFSHAILALIRAVRRILIPPRVMVSLAA